MIKRKNEELEKAFKKIDKKWIESLNEIDDEKEIEVKLNSFQLGLIRDIIADWIYEGEE